MLRSTSDNQHPHKSALALRREMQLAIGQQLSVECELPQDLPLEPTTPLSAGTENLIPTRTSSVPVDYPLASVASNRRK